MKLLSFSPSTVLFGAGLGYLLQAILLLPAWANCTGEQINQICFTTHGEGVLEQSPGRLDQIQQSQSLQLTVELAEEMEVAIAQPQITTGSPDPGGTQRQASLTAFGSTVNSATGQTVILPANQAVTFSVEMDVTRPQAFAPDSYGHAIPLSFVPTSPGGTVTDYDLDFAGTVETACLNDAVQGGTLAASETRHLSSVQFRGRPVFPATASQLAGELRSNVTSPGQHSR